jgi:signal transduction histidine kinase
VRVPQGEPAGDSNDRRAQLLADTGKLLASSLDPETTLESVAQLAVPEFADFCIVDLLDDHGQARRVAAAHFDPRERALLDELRRRYPPRWSSPAPAAQAIARGEPQFAPELTPEQLARLTVDAGHYDLMTRIGVRSSIAVPLYARGRTLGAISFGFARSGRSYHLADVRVAEELALRAALAIDNARLYAEADAARKSAELDRQRLDEALHQAEAANRAKDEFLAMLGHELRNPLAPIATAVQLLNMRRDPDARRPELAVIDRQVKHVIRLVDDLLDVSRITRGKVQLKRSRIEASQVVSDAVEMASPLLEQRRHHLTVSVARGGLPLDADDARLAQVVANLLTNAAKYTEPGGEISIAATVEDGEVVIRVRDNGRGIAGEMLSRIFELFVQGQRSPDRAEGGLGLGLALVRSLVELHGGSVSAHSDGPGCGSEFVVRLPEAPVESAAPDVAAVVSPAGGFSPQKRVLLVDDNGDAAELLGEVLRSAGHQVAIAHDGPEALGLLQQFHPEVAVLDIGLPVMDGYELARRLRKSFRQLRCIAVTGYGQETDRARSRQAGFELHLVKPVDVSALLQAVGH